MCTKGCRRPWPPNPPQSLAADTPKHGRHSKTTFGTQRSHQLRYNNRHHVRANYKHMHVDGSAAPAAASIRTLHSHHRGAWFQIVASQLRIGVTLARAYFTDSGNMSNKFNKYARLTLHYTILFTTLHYTTALHLYYTTLH